MEFLKAALLKQWYQQASLLMYLLLPIQLLFLLLSSSRKALYKFAVFPENQIPVPLIVVGNLSVGGTGKTPLVIAIVEYLKSQGMNPGVVSRGYGGRADAYPLLVSGHSKAAESGDEPLLIFQRTGVPVVVDPNRSRAAKLLVFEASCDVIISDDGLQHYGMSRDFEIVVVDAKRGFGNKQVLPIGPLREPLSRLAEVDSVVLNMPQSLDDEVYRDLQETLKTFGESVSQFQMQLKPEELMPLKQTHYHLMPVSGDRVHAVAGIGNPKRFFETLSNLGFDVVPHEFDDHYDFKLEDFTFEVEYPVIMTEKDAVKCQGFEHSNLWYLPVDAEIDSGLYKKLDALLNLANKNEKN